MRKVKSFNVHVSRPQKNPEINSGQVLALGGA